MLWVDRDVQRDILVRLREVYPKTVESDTVLAGTAEAAVAPNVAYLEEHGLLTATWTGEIDDGEDYPVLLRITAQGIDFLADDGGLSAILGVVTIKLHDDTIRSLIISRVTASKVPESTKAKLIDQVRGLPAEALRTIAMKALEAGLDQTPDIAAWLRRLLGL